MRYITPRKLKTALICNGVQLIEDVWLMASNFVLLAMLFDGLHQLWAILLLDQPPFCLFSTVSLFIAIGNMTQIMKSVIFVFLLCRWIIAIFKECMIKGSKSQSLYIYILDFNASKLFHKWKKLSNAVCHFFLNIFKF